MSVLVAVHQKLGAALLLVLLAGAAAAALAMRRSGNLPALRAYVWLCAAAILLQAIVGGILLASGSRPQSVLHLLYGAVTLLALPIAVGYARVVGRREALILGAGLLAAMLLALRALLTG